METDQIIEQPRDLSSEIDNQIQRWHRGAFWLHTTYISMGTISVISSLVVAGFTKDLGEWWTKILATTSATSVALMKTTDVGRKGNGFRQAHRYLRTEKMLFDKGESSVERLIQAYAKAETLIGDVEVKVSNS